MVISAPVGLLVFLTIAGVLALWLIPMPARVHRVVEILVIVCVIVLIVMVVLMALNNMGGVHFGEVD